MNYLPAIIDIAEQAGQAILAIYQQDAKGNVKPEQLIDGMKVLDERFEGNVPRFIGYPDNRDFFFLTRKPKS